MRRNPGILGAGIAVAVGLLAAGPVSAGGNAAPARLAPSGVTPAGFTTPLEVVTGHFEELSEARMRYTVRRLAGRASGKHVVLALLGANTERSAGMDPVSQAGFKTAYTLKATVNDISALTRKSQRSLV